MSDVSKKKIQIICLIIGIIALAVSVFKFVLDYKKYNDDMASASTSIMELHKNIQSQNALLDEWSRKLAAQSSEFFTVSDSSSAVADIQTMLHANSCGQAQPDDPDMSALIERLKVYFSDEEAVEWQFSAVLDRSLFPEDTVVDREFTWRCMTECSFGVSGFTVVWGCYPFGSSSMVAYALADYDAVADRFSNVKVYPLSSTPVMPASEVFDEGGDH